MKIILDTTIRDWSIAKKADQDLTPEQRRDYRLKIEFNECSGQLALSIADTAGEDPDGGEFSAELYIEINRGLPCLHIGNVVGGDNVAHLFVCKDGVDLLPDSGLTRIERIPTSTYYPEARDYGVRFSDPVPVEIPACEVKV